MIALPPNHGAEIARVTDLAGRAIDACVGFLAGAPDADQKCVLIAFGPALGTPAVDPRFPFTAEVFESRAEAATKLCEVFKYLRVASNDSVLAKLAAPPTPGHFLAVVVNLCGCTVTIERCLATCPEPRPSAPGGSA